MHTLLNPFKLVGLLNFFKRRDALINGLAYTLYRDELLKLLVGLLSNVLKTNLLAYKYYLRGLKKVNPRLVRRVLLN